MTVYYLDALTLREIENIPRDNLISILPIGSIESHGPHLPLGTDTIIAENLAKKVAEELSCQSHDTVIFPSFAYSSAGFAEGFDGTVNISSGSVNGLLDSICKNLAKNRIRYLLVVNVHFDPAHLKVLHEVFDNITEVKVIFPDFTKRKFAEQIGGEFLTGSCHAGQFETSLILAVRPELAKNYKNLKSNSVNLPEQIKAGSTSFKDVGMGNSYCGAPSKASAEEGKHLYKVLGSILGNETMKVIRNQL